MPIKKAAFKALRQMKKNYSRNTAAKADIQVLLRKSRKLIEGLKLKEAGESVKKTVVALDKAAQRGILKKNTVSRLKSRLVGALNVAGAKKK